MDFLVHTAEPGKHDEEVRDLGSQIISCPPTGLRRPWSYATYPRQLVSLLEKHGPYDVVHGHIQEFSGYFLRAAARVGVKLRIAHSHNGAPPTERAPGPLRRAYSRLMRRWVNQYATGGLACSRVAARSLYGERWEDDDRWQILHYGIDLVPFSQRFDMHEERSRLGIPATARVVGHVGRFVEQKNHAFLLDVIAECLKLNSDIYFLLIGDGHLRSSIERVAHERGLSQNVVFTGARSDVPRLMMSAMDLFVLPSLWEGLGIVLLEAQAAGLLALVSEHVPDECGVIPGQIELGQLAHGPKHWAERILRGLDRKMCDRQEALEAVASSRFTIERSARLLQAVYTSGPLPQELPANLGHAFGRNAVATVSCER
jgi:glycosyltransferase involved in cell wall biosynthesis